MGVSLYPAISQSPGGQLYGWLPLSNAYGISSIEMQHKIKQLSAFLPLKTMHGLPNLQFGKSDSGHL